MTSEVHKKRKLLIGIDVGGTNSDLVVLEPEKLDSENRGVIAWHKSVTTPDVSVGIEQAITAVLENPNYNISRDEVISVTIGTTHFINAVIERDTKRLEKVAVIRLSGPFGQSSPPFGDFPVDLAEIINGYCASIDGGSEISGKDIRKLDEIGLREHCKKIKALGITAVAIVGIFSNMNATQEKRAGKIVLEEIPDCDLVLSHTISGIGLIERENASVLNASIKRFGRKIIRSFVGATRRLGLNCPVMLSQNDGTVLSVADALEIPIRTFSSGATNSMRGAAILCSGDSDVEGKNVIVCDVGGTTTDVGQVLPTGFPRQSAMYSYVGGVRMNFSMPHVVSIGLGGGSIVRVDDDPNHTLTVGPDSTGSEIVTKSLLFGGDTVTTSDVSVGEFVDSQGLEVLPDYMKMGTPGIVQGRFDSEYKSKYTAVVRRHLERAIDRVKTSRDDIPVIFVGGGSFIAPDDLDGTCKVIKPPFSQVANAIGAALGKISSSVSEFRTLKDGEEEVEKQAIIEELIKKATEDAISKGASASSLEVVNVVSDAVPYVPNVYQFEVKVVGKVDYDHLLQMAAKVSFLEQVQKEVYTSEVVYKEAKVSKKETVDYDYASYSPVVKDGIWTLTEIDIDFISCGAYILGCGGGGDPHSPAIELKRMIREGKKVNIVTLEKFAEMTGGKGRAINVGYFGSPTISGEKLHGDEILQSLSQMEKYEGFKTDGIFMFEIGGGNGLSGLWTGCVRGLPVVDMDLMGRAYPTQWQSLPSVYHDKKGYPYVTVSDGNGFQMTITSAVDDVQLEDILRDSMYNLGCQGACVEPSMSIAEMEKETVHNPVSLSWRIGRAVHIASFSSDLDNLPKYIIDATGGPGSTRCLLTGKIVSVEKKLKRGYGYGVIEIESLEEDTETHEKTTIKIPFKNENIVAYQIQDDGTSLPLCSVPDLITLVDTDGNAVGTQDYRYGLVVYIMVFASSDKWRTPQAINIGGPQAFGEAFEKITYKPTGKNVPTVPVADEFNS
ncbi:DEKNAAC103235 [Brettanomyces naardenensis]|uniref:DEKNAAC103235 n=1 Tax=Brettanomyces naardenensis TaxID=13370 RepID=A0A448YMQ8_BRENA|nr:DEKNAAC103235 [Brettanomyces naardenensis]